MTVTEYGHWEVTLPAHSSIPGKGTGVPRTAETPWVSPENSQSSFHSVKSLLPCLSLFPCQPFISQGCADLEKRRKPLRSRSWACFLSHCRAGGHRSLWGMISSSVPGSKNGFAGSACCPSFWSERSCPVSCAIV